MTSLECSGIMYLVLMFARAGIQLIELNTIQKSKLDEPHVLSLDSGIYENDENYRDRKYPFGN